MGLTVRMGDNARDVARGVGERVVVHILMSACKYLHSLLSQNVLYSFSFEERYKRRLKPFIEQKIRSDFRCTIICLMFCSMFYCFKLKSKKYIERLIDPGRWLVAAAEQLRAEH